MLEQKAPPCPSHSLGNNPENPDWRWQLLALFPQSQLPTLSKHWDVKAISPCVLVVPAARSSSSGSLLQSWVICGPRCFIRTHQHIPVRISQGSSQAPCFPLERPLSFHPHILCPLVFIPVSSSALPSPQVSPGGWSHPWSPLLPLPSVWGLGVRAAPGQVIIGIDSTGHGRLINNLCLY